MPNDSSPVIAKLNDLIKERDGYLASAAEVEGRIKKVYELLGLDPSTAPGVEHTGLPRLPSSTFAAKYPLQPDTMGAVMVELLLKADRGYSRPEMRRELEKHPKFARQIGHNVNSFYNTVNRYLTKGRIVLVNNLLYHPDRAPLPEGETDPTGQHLPSNVSSLFPDRMAGGDE